jgi:ADP-heptose:LPS heptosyltransferase
VLLLQNKFSVFISGSEEEGKLVAPLLEKHPEVTSVCGKFSLGEFISFISHCDALVAASTGPLHIASALGKNAIGLYAPMRPIHPGRWAPLGKDSHAISLEKNCNDCKYSQECACIKSISPRQVLEFILQ